jgi:hypothetical protein
MRITTLRTSSILMISRTSIRRSVLGVLWLCAANLAAAEFPDPLVDNKSLLGICSKGSRLPCWQAAASGAWRRYSSRLRGWRL